MAKKKTLEHSFGPPNPGKLMVLGPFRIWVTTCYNNHQQTLQMRVVDSHGRLLLIYKNIYYIYIYFLASSPKGSTRAFFHSRVKQSSLFYAGFLPTVNKSPNSVPFLLMYSITIIRFEVGITKWFMAQWWSTKRNAYFKSVFEYCTFDSCFGVQYFRASPKCSAGIPNVYIQR